MSSLTLYDTPNPQPPTPVAPPMPPPESIGAVPLTARVNALEEEVTDLRQHVTQLAEIVVGEIKERRATQTYTDIVLPSSLLAAVPGGEKTLKAVNAIRKPWLLVDLLSDLGLTVRMYFDPRYRVRRSTQLVVPLILACYVAGYFVFAQFAIPFISPILERLIDIVLAVLLYKVIASELLRYRDVLALYTASRVANHSSTPLSMLHNDPDEAAVSRQEDS